MRRAPINIATAMALSVGLLAGTLLARNHIHRSLASRDSSGNRPRLVLPNTARDLGTLRRGEVRQEVFRIRNEGTKRLVLTEESTPCCGSTPRARAFIVEPGESWLLEIELDTSDFHGRLAHTATFGTNDPHRPRFTLTVRANIDSAK